MIKPGKGCAAGVCWTEERPLPGVNPGVGLEVRELEVRLPARSLLAPEGAHPGVLLCLFGPGKIKYIEAMNQRTIDVLLFLLLFLFSLRGDNIDDDLMIPNEKVFAETGLFLFVIIDAIL